MNSHDTIVEYLLENTSVKEIDLTKLLFEDEDEPGYFYKVNQNGERTIIYGIYALWTVDDDDQSSVYSKGGSDY